MASKRCRAEALSEDESLLDCPVCLESPILPPIMQCRHGHLLCRPCSEKMAVCPMCKDGPVDIRNLTAEKFAQREKFPCHNAPACREMIEYSRFSEHLGSCECSPFECPVSKPCGPERLPMDVSVIMKHLKDSHGAKDLQAFKFDEQCVSVKRVITGNLSHTSWAPRVIDAFGETFVHFAAKPTFGLHHIACWLQLVGPRSASTAFKYRIAVSGQNRMLAYEGCPKPISESAACIVGDDDCLLVSEKFANLVNVVAEGKHDGEVRLLIEISIWKLRQ
eukprot:TRINITY_DN47796_c0_g1_i1.p1 TRINITY_DN47796_c0_g1~~TRINITY_DN47796_c0_g1_i1.p1  ORF type:complete len:277 (+),score=12.89 TRINITY_DN47796_c0_g1_i1:225-1055(+)